MENPIKMPVSLTNLYWSQDLPGFEVVIPLKLYHGYLMSKGDQSHGLYSIMWRIMHVVTGLFAYPILGSFAVTSKYRSVQMQVFGNWAMGLSFYFGLNQSELPFCDNIPPQPDLDSEFLTKMGMKTKKQLSAKLLHDFHHLPFVTSESLS